LKLIHKIDELESRINDSRKSSREDRTDSKTDKSNDS